MTEPILEIDNLRISFFTRAGEIPAVMDFSLQGLCRARRWGWSANPAAANRRSRSRSCAICRGSAASPRARSTSRAATWASCRNAELRAIRGSKIAMVYQEPMASLNPTMRIGRQLMEVPLIHDKVTQGRGAQRARSKWSRRCACPTPSACCASYPHQLSGGQQQRIVIAMALLSNPQLLILDEPTTALDVTVEAGIVELVKDLTARTGASSLFISHNLGLILETCDRVTVMYSGEAVETGAVRDVFGAVRHPYTQGLFRSMPMPGANKNDEPLIPIPGQLPLPHQRPPGCHFGPRCSLFRRRPSATARKSADVPGRRPSTATRAAACASTRSTGARGRRGAERPAPIEIGEPVLEVDRSEETLSGRRDPVFGGARGPHGQGGRGHLVRRPRSGGRRDRRRIRLRQIDARQGAARAGDGERRHRRRSTIAPSRARRSTGATRKTIASVQMIFQNPFDTLNPSYTVGSQIHAHAGALRRRRRRSAERRDTMLNLLDLVKLPRAFAERAPRQLSGGQKQRIGVARAFAGQPRADHRRRADVGARRLGAGGDQRTADEPAARVEDDDGVHQPRPFGRALSRRPRDRDVSRPYRRDGRDASRFSRRRSIPIPRRCCRRSRSPIPRSGSAIVVLEGEIPSAMSPPPGCPFQTRCGWKSRGRRRPLRARGSADARRRRRPYDQVPPAARDAGRMEPVFS